ncbi:hypothetical protein [Pseudomonas laurylsulfatiphila]
MHSFLKGIGSIAFGVVAFLAFYLITSDFLRRGSARTGDFTQTAA